MQALLQLKQTLYQLYQSEHVQSCLDKCSLAEPKNQQILALVIGALMLSVLVFSIGWNLAKHLLTPTDSRNYLYIPFDEYDATSICNQEMESRLGDQLLRSYVDAHSTRLDNRKGLYRVYIKADVGDLRDFREVMVYCFVDKWDHDLAYYKEVDPTKKQILTSDLKFFKN